MLFEVRGKFPYYTHIEIVKSAVWSIVWVGITIQLWLKYALAY